VPHLIVTLWPDKTEARKPPPSEVILRDVTNV